MANDERSFGERIEHAMHEHLVDFIRKGQWLAMDYRSRVEFDGTLLRTAYARIDKEKVLAQVVEQAEQHLANKIFDAMATELTSDAKQILSNKELREDVRAILREKMRAAAAALGPG